MEASMTLFEQAAYGQEVVNHPGMQAHFLAALDAQMSRAKTLFESMAACYATNHKSEGCTPWCRICRLKAAAQPAQQQKQRPS